MSENNITAMTSTAQSVTTIKPYELVGWRDRLVEHPDIWVEEELKDGRIRHTPAQGKVIDRGTPVNSKNLGYMDVGIWTNRFYLLSILARVNAMENAMNALSKGTISLDAKNQFLCDFGTLNGLRVEKGWYDSARGVLVCID